MPFLRELSRRNVFKAGAAYAVVAWLLIQVADVVLPTFNAPAWIMQVFTFFMILGFPLTLLFAWAYEMTPAGIRRTDDSASDVPVQPGSTTSGVLFGLALMGAVAIGFLLRSIEPGSLSGPGSGRPAERPASNTGSSHFDLAFADDAPLAFIGAAAIGVGRRAFAVSPDGTRFVYVAKVDDQYRLFLRELDGHEARPLPGTDGAYDPFFSPNGAWIGFFSGNRLEKIRVSGGTPVVVAETTNPAGAHWFADDQIVVAIDEAEQVVSIPAQGGEPETLVMRLGAPRVLEQGRWLLGMSTGERPAPLIVVDTETGKRSNLPVVGAAPKVIDGYLFFTRDSDLMAARFDAATATVESSAVPVLTDVRVESYGDGQWSVSDGGMLVYASGRASGSNPMTWVGASGEQDLGLPLRNRGTFELSPDGSKLIVLERSAAGQDLWLYDLATGASRKLTIDGQVASPFFWMPDGQHVVYHRIMDDAVVPIIQNLNSSGGGSPFLPDPWSSYQAVSISADGRFVGANASPGQEHGILVYDLFENEMTIVTEYGYTHWGTAISPDGKAVVYTSGESGEYQNYLEPFPPTGERYQISRDGGAEEPRWSRDGTKVYYRSGQRIMVVPVSTSPTISIGAPEVFLAVEFENVANRSYDIHPDGERALVIKGENLASSVHVVTNWFDEVGRMIDQEAGAQAGQER
ncbi:MAG: hypothetical protein R3358_07060 [Woeseiaceae bacterium]|nr:hypothetical protein [Woeseiaceae bacterium]